jgi:hypothetical protein
MQGDKALTVTHEGDMVKINGHPIRMEFMVRDAFWANGCAIVLLDPDAYLDNPAYGARRRARGRKPVHNLRALSSAGATLWQAEFPEPADYYYRIESRDPLVALSFSAYRCEIDARTGRIKSKALLK